MKNYDESKVYVQGITDLYTERVRHFMTEIKFMELPLTKKALLLVMTEMCVEKGFSRRDGTDYFTHPIALAQRGLDMGIIDDVLLASSLLHDIVEDVEHIDIDYITFEFGEEVAEAVDNVTKRDGEENVDYVKRFTSKEKSLMLKLLDILHNI